MVDDVMADTMEKIDRMTTTRIHIKRDWVMTPEDVEKISDIIRTSPILRHVYIQARPNGELLEFVESTLANKHIKYLDVLHCIFPEHTFAGLATNTTLNAFGIDYCTALGAGNRVLIDALKVNKTIINFVFCHMEFESEEDTDAFCAMMMTKKSSLRFFGYGYRGVFTDNRSDFNIARKITSLLKQFTSLVRLHILINNHHSGVFELLVDMIKTNRSIKEIVMRVYYGFIGSDILLAAVSHNCTIELIDHKVSHIGFVDNKHDFGEERYNRLLEKSRGPLVGRACTVSGKDRENTTVKKDASLFVLNPAIGGPPVHEYFRNSNFLRTGPAISPVANLTTLSLIKCNIRSRTPFPSCPNLRALDLSDNFLLDRFDISRFPLLEWLKLSRCDFAEFDHMTKTKLAVLFIDFNPIQQIPSILHVEEVYCAGCPFYTTDTNQGGIDFDKERGVDNAKEIQAAYLNRMLSVMAFEVGLI